MTDDEVVIRHMRKVRHMNKIRDNFREKESNIYYSRFQICDNLEV